MFNMLRSFASAGASQLSKYSGMIQSAKPTCTGLNLGITGSNTNTSVVNTVVPSRNKRFEHHFINRWMARDYKRRALVKEHFAERQRYVAIKRCFVLPKELQEVAAAELHAFPRDSCHVRTKRRCILTSRPRWVLHKYRLSRIQWRLLADYNKMSGVLRATW